ncbi:MAG: aminoacyl--tRNA ligase-related protein [Patescibacteria group bacterium]
MRQSFLFTKTRREAPKDETAKNAQLLIRAGFIHKEMAGVYSYLPLGLRVLNKISDIIREEMNAIGGQEIQMSLLQDRELWEKTGRWDDKLVDNWFKTKLKNGSDLGLALTNEEPVTNILREHIQSHKDLPKSVYQINTKFRNEVRAKAGVMRGREFPMKDLYSFNKDEKSHIEFYEKVSTSYERIFERVGISDRTVKTFASGGIFSKFSHEFQTICETGEDVIYTYTDERTGKLGAINKEIFTDDLKKELMVDNFIEKKSVEVGNIFTLGTRFSESLGLRYKDENGESVPVFMGSYGIGPSRLMGTVVEVLSDEKGIVWPESVAPFTIHLLSLDAETKGEADALYEKLVQEGKEVLYDDRDVAAGEKFADADLIGIPTRYVISKKSLSTGGIEVKDRKTGAIKYA